MSGSIGMIGGRGQIRAGFARGAWLLLLGCNGNLEVGDTMNSGGSGGAPSQGSGGAVSQGSGGKVSAGGVVETLSLSDTASVIGTSKSCPTERVMDLASCAEERTVCGYWTAGADGQEYSECGCFEAGGGALQWFCYAGEWGALNCPLSLPTTGASCSGSFGSSCHYPVQTTCKCDPEIGTWACEGPAVRDYLEPPTTLNLSTPIAELSNAERDALCVWLSDAESGPGFPPENPAEIDPRGFAINAPCSACWDFYDNGRVPSLSLGQCAANLSFSTCAAPVSELVDCVATIYGGCWPRPHGCARYTERPGCAGTVVTMDEDAKSSSFCSVRVE